MLGFAYRQKVLTPQVPPPTDLSGKTALITGGTSGLGFECALQLLQRGISHLLITSRSLERCRTAKEALLARLVELQPEGASANPEISTYELDHGSFESVCTFADQIKAHHRGGTLDIAVLNAGVRRFFPKTVADTGYEEMLQVNHLATALLALLLWPVMRLRGSGGGARRLVINSSETHAHTTFPQRHEPHILQHLALTDRADFNAWDQYNLSKLVNILFTRELAARTDPRELVITIVNPGLVFTGMGAEDEKTMPFLQWAVGRTFVNLFARRADVAARTLVDAVLREPVAQGEYLNGRGITLS